MILITVIEHLLYPGTELIWFCHLTFIIAPSDKYYYFTHITDDKTEAQ